MSQSATPATQNDTSTSSDTSRKTRFCGFSHRHGNFSPRTVAHTDSSSHTSNVTKCHACRAKRHEHIFWHIEKDTFWWLFPYRHGNFTLTTVVCLRTVADGCRRLRTVADTRSRVTRTRVNPQTPKCKARTLRYAFGKQGTPWPCSEIFAHKRTQKKENMNDYE